MLASLNAAPVQQVSVPDCFESYRLADKFCEQRLVTDDRVRAIVVDAFASGYGFGIAAAPVAKQVAMPERKWLQSDGLIYSLKSGMNYYEINVTQVEGSRHNAQRAEFARKLIDLLNAAPIPDHSEDVRAMVVPDVDALKAEIASLSVRLENSDAVISSIQKIITRLNATSPNQ